MQALPYSADVAQRLTQALMQPFGWNTVRENDTEWALQHQNGLFISVQTHAHQWEVHCIHHAIIMGTTEDDGSFNYDDVLQDTTPQWMMEQHYTLLGMLKPAAIVDQAHICQALDQQWGPSAQAILRALRAYLGDIAPYEQGFYALHGEHEAFLSETIEFSRQTPGGLRSLLEDHNLCILHADGVLKPPSLIKLPSKNSHHAHVQHLHALQHIPLPWPEWMFC